MTRESDELQNSRTPVCGRGSGLGRLILLGVSCSRAQLDTATRTLYVTSARGQSLVRSSSRRTSLVCSSRARKTVWL